MDQTIDILDRLQEEEGLVRLVLMSGLSVVGTAQCIVYDEDDEGWETVKKIMFAPKGMEHAVFYQAEEIKDYETLT